MQIGNLLLKSPFMNASGCYCRSLEELDELVLCESDAIVCKTATINPRNGNELPRVYVNDTFSLNSSGLPNLGLETYIKWKESQVGKPVIYSVSGSEVSGMYEYVNKLDNLEINMSCPNLLNCGILSYDRDNFREILRRWFELRDLNLNWGVKLSPYFDSYQFDIICDVIESYPINFITTLNSIPNCLWIDTETDSVVIKPKEGIGGLGGSPVLPVGLSNVRQWYKLLGDKITITGCGGITSGQDVYRYLLAGASTVQIGTLLLQEGLSSFTRLKKELNEILVKKELNISQIIGKVKNDI